MRNVSMNPRKCMRSFGYAIEGLHFVINNHPNFGFQGIVALMTIGLGLYFRISRFEWLVLVITVFWILVAELFNTSVEITLDYMAREHHIKVKVAKDVAAGAVLLSSVGAVVIGLIIFVPYFLGV